MLMRKIIWTMRLGRDAEVKETKRGQTLYFGAAFNAGGGTKWCGCFYNNYPRSEKFVNAMKKGKQIVVDADVTRVDEEGNWTLNVSNVHFTFTPEKKDEDAPEGFRPAPAPTPSYGAQQEAFGADEDIPF